MVFLKDFSFLRRKEFFLFCFALVTLAYFQLAFSLTRNPSSVQPVLIIENGPLETIGVFLPLFTVVFLFFQHKKSYSQSWIPWINWGLIGGILLLMIVLFPNPSLFSDFDDISGESNATTPDDTEFNEPITVDLPEQNPSLDNASGDFVSISNLIFDLVKVIFWGVLLLPLLILFLARGQESEDQLSEPEEETYPAYRTTEHLAQSILDYYYRASNTLEKRGADDSVTLTPSEFTNDVIRKKLSLPPVISNLTSLFEEAKFSQHSMGQGHEQQAKDLSNSIIFPSFMTESSESTQMDKPTETKTGRKNG
ncbi:MAG: DUF4129 domain-containing protein [Candidatus Thorarchaeota archaeon]